MSPPSREYSATTAEAAAVGGVNDLPLSACTHEGDTASWRRVCCRRRSRMTSFSLIAAVSVAALEVSSWIPMCVTRFHDSNCMPTCSNNFALEEKRTNTRTHARTHTRAWEEGRERARRSRRRLQRGGSARGYIKKFLRHEWISDRAFGKGAKGAPHLGENAS